jgi:glycosyltransferase involved in cell wall biosynthesis
VTRPHVSSDRDVAISLIVCTQNRAGRLDRFFGALATLEPPEGGWELVMVDSASTDATPAAIARFAGQAPIRVRQLRADVPGLSRARNLGMTGAAGAIFAFTDDDCYPRPDYLRQVQRVFEERRVGVVGGRVVLHDPTDARVGVQESSEPFEIAAPAFVRAGLLHGANMAVRREVVDTIGGFDVLLGAGSRCRAGEDTELIARALWAGWPVRYDPRPVVAHHHGRKPGAHEARQRRDYDVGRGACYAPFLLDRDARLAYVRGWWLRTREYHGPDRAGRLARELGGALRYLVARFAHGGSRTAAGIGASTAAARTDRPTAARTDSSTGAATAAETGASTVAETDASTTVAETGASTAAALHASSSFEAAGSARAKRQG